jgi:pimeloyl-ACP methyl ester carboxylesterase
MRPRAYLPVAAVLPLLASTPGCIAPIEADSAGGTSSEIRLPPTRVYLLRGLADVFSTGLDTLADKLNASGATARSFSGPLWPELVTEIRQLGERGEPNLPLVLIGHSYGADQAILTAGELAASGIRVDLLLLVDATAPPPIPTNVLRCVHVYIPTPFGAAAPELFAGNPVVPGGGNTGTQVVNRVFSVEEFGPRAARVDHFTLDTSPRLHEYLIAEIAALHAEVARDIQSK